MWFSEYSEQFYWFTIFFEKCKQTAEISWLFIWDVKISKSFVKQIFCIFYSYVRTYLGLSCPTTQQLKISFQRPCFVINWYTSGKLIPPADFLYFVKYHPILNFLKKNPKQIKRHLGKVWKNTKTRKKSANFYCNSDRKV